MSLEAVIDNRHLAPFSKLANAVAAPLEFVAKTGYHALHAANPVRDLTEFVKGAYGLLTEKKSWKDYKADLKQGKFLGKGNLAKVLFYSGIALSGAYIPLLITRAAIGGGAYLTKRLATWEPMKNKVASLVDKLSFVPAAIGGALGFGYYKTKNAFSKDNASRTLEKWHDDKYFRKNVTPAILDGAIAAKGYAGVVGLKWLSSLIKKGGEKLQNSKYNPVKWFGKKLSGVGNLGYNALGDYLSAAVFAGGLHGSTKVSPVQAYENAVSFVDSTRNDVGHAWTAVKNAGSELGAEVGKWFGDAKDSIADKLPFVDNPSEKYAVITVGYDKDKGWLKLTDASDMFIADASKVYDDLVKMGFKQENIKVLTPDGNFNPKFGSYKNLEQAMNDKSYNHHASEDNLKRILDDVSKKVDRNDVFTLYVASHGLNNNDDSYVGLQNGREDLYDYELKEYTKNIKGGKELYVVGACHSGGFADKLGQGKDVAVSACKTYQPAISDNRGNSLTAYFYDELAKKDLSSQTSEQDIKEALLKAEERFKQDHRDSWLYSREVAAQKPVIGTDGRAYTVGSGWFGLN